MNRSPSLLSTSSSSCVERVCADSRPDVIPEHEWYYHRLNCIPSGDTESSLPPEEDQLEDVIQNIEFHPDHIYSDDQGKSHCRQDENDNVLDRESIDIFVIVIHHTVFLCEGVNLLFALK